MRLVSLDWIVIVVSLLIAFVPALMMARRAGQNTEEFFTSGRAAPWWLIGISMVATTFSTDTPNLVTDLVRQGGVAGNWAWWAFLLTGMATVMFYARMWRRSGVLTDLAFYEIRYSGRAASLVRGFRAVYLGLVFNVVIMATVNLAAVKIDGLRELKAELVRSKADAIRRAVSRKLLAYALGRRLNIADVEAADALAARLRDDGDGLGDLVAMVVQSEVFQAR